MNSLGSIATARDEMNSSAAPCRKGMATSCFCSDFAIQLFCWKSSPLYSWQGTKYEWLPIPLGDQERYADGEIHGNPIVIRCCAIKAHILLKARWAEA